MKKKITNWGNYPKVMADVSEPRFKEEIPKIIQDNPSLIPRGNGRSYGDASLHSKIISTRRLNAILNLDEDKKIITCQSGILLSEILDFIIPKGFFLAVTPGTKYVSLGGAIAADIHGKNHHQDGCFSNYVVSFEIIQSDKKLIQCSHHTNANIFKDTFGAMGRTGVITQATIKLKKIETAYIKLETLKSQNLRNIFTSFEKSQNFTYTVAWIDCLKKGKSLGRGFLMRGEHAIYNDLENKHKKEPLHWKPKKKLNISIYFPSFVLNRWLVKTFNAFIYYNQKNKHTLVDIDTFFYPLDKILNWNRIYGKKGFIQYQLVCPIDKSYECLSEIIQLVSKIKYSSFLSVLKLFGNESPYARHSFPIKGYTLALDIKIFSKIHEFVREADQITKKYGGKVYLAKDAMSNAFVIKDLYKTESKFQSNQFLRISKKTFLKLK